MKTIFILRKPLEGNLVKNTLTHGCGGLNIDAARLPTTDFIFNNSRGADAAKSKGIYGDSRTQESHQTEGQKLGRFPANFLLADIETARGLDNQSGFIPHNYRQKRKDGHSSIWGSGKKSLEIHEGYRDSGGASRYFKTIKKDNGG